MQIIKKIADKYFCFQQMVKTNEKIKVYLAFDKENNRYCIIKEIDVSGSTEEEIHKFQRQIKDLFTLETNIIVKPYNFGREENSQYLALPYLSGNLAFLYAPFKEESHALNIAAKIVCGMKEIEQYLAHRNISPDNIIIDKNFNPHLIGISEIKDPHTHNDFTIAGTKIGTPGYRSPEQIDGLEEGKKLDSRSDIFSLGATLYFLLTNIPPFDPLRTGKGLKMDRATIRTTPEEINSLRNKQNLSPITENTCELIKKMMEKNREDRFDNFKELYLFIMNTYRK